VSTLDDAPRVGTVAHRIVHGGDRFEEPTLVDDEVVAALRELAELAPLHMTPALAALDDARRAVPDVPHVAVFDTAFHRTIPERASTYALPQRFRDRGIRRFGFHGLSVAWAAEQMPVPRLVVCHLGGGCSVTAVRDGESVDTTMGFTPLDGVPMGTRAGSVDPGALAYLLRRGVTLDELERALERESGLVGLAGTNDVAALLASDAPEAALALEIFCYRVAQAVAAMAAALGGVDAVVFTGGIGEHAAPVRDAVVEQLAFLRPFDVRVVPAREDVVAARAARALL
jgi:acetate kinase